jgi:hypothetical protein
MTARHSLLGAGRRKQQTSTHAAANTHLSRFARVGPVLLLDRRHAFPGHVRCRYSCPAAVSLAAAALGLPASRPSRTALAQCSARPARARPRFVVTSRWCADAYPSFKQTVSVFGNRVARGEVTTHIESRAWNALPSLTPASAPPTSPSAATPKESHDEEQQYCTDGSVDDCADHSSTEMDT